MFLASVRLCILSLLVGELQSIDWSLNTANKETRIQDDEADIEEQLRNIKDAEIWKSWKSTHGKSYTSSVEELERYTVWQSNRAYIESHNNLSELHGFTLGMNQFGDLTPEEYLHSATCVHLLRESNVTYFDPWRQSQQWNLPEWVDWRTKGIVTPVKDQERCHSSYAFAVTGALEGMHALETGNLTSLSEQNIIDCSVPYGNCGCGGGTREASFLYLVDIGGIESETTYPYVAKQSLCNFNQDAIEASCTGTIQITKGQETDLQIAVAMVGPVTVAVDSRHPSFQFYASGIFDEPNCSSTKLTHSMLVIGYGTEDGKDYWIVKNSWGTNWGMSGYMKMTRNSANQCGIATRAIYPTM